ncbi:hypothetical protein SFMTTN_1389 [Sulfuriferula multivorans]|uniref:Uncharacterized protein n=1 Tax=Sulfuriferula multivorans TaxID=1559896 RepID=A0A401JD99_9PROT|nr:hypothetical protein [Sulfuriferula multivorans]GBL45579.1 hypothetical protein SFMTTN_1389 [Sulfuriferula multivorans]
MKHAPPAPHAVGHHGDDRWLLLWAALIGALAAVAFHEGMALTGHLATQHPGSLVSAAEALSPVPAKAHVSRRTPRNE